jgi:hypothetical protein
VERSIVTMADSNYYKMKCFVEDSLQMSKAEVKKMTKQ